MMIDFINFLFLIKSMSYDDAHHMDSNWKVDSNIVFKDKEYNSEISRVRHGEME